MKTSINSPVVIKQLSIRFVLLFSIFIFVSLFSDKTTAQENASVSYTSLKEGNGTWFDGFEFRASNNQNATISVDFYGTGIRWNGKRYADGGIISASIDGIDKGNFNIANLAAINDTKVFYDFTGLSLGNHKLVLTQTSSNTYINYSYFSNLDTKVFLNGDGWAKSTPVFNYCANIGSSVTVNFIGTGIRWFGQEWDNSGITTFAVDGEAPIDIDAYGPIGTPITWEKSNLSNGSHTLVCTLSGRRNPSSTGNAFNFQSFEPIGSNGDQQYGSLAATSLTEGNNNWFNGSQIRASSETGATISANFYGTGIRWNGRRYANGGIISASIDGIDKGSFDISNLAVVDDANVFYDFTDLSLGNHELVLTQTSSNTYINYSHFCNLDTKIFLNGVGWAKSTPVFNYCAYIGSSVTVNFIGNGIRWYGQEWDNSGITTFAVDGESPVDIDGYGPIGTPITWEKSNLSNGSHTLVCTLSGRRNSSSTGNAFNFQSFEPIRSNFVSGIFSNTNSEFTRHGDKLLFVNGTNRENLNLKIYNILGQCIHSELIPTNKNEIELPKFKGFQLIVLFNSKSQCIFSSKRVD